MKTINGYDFQKASLMAHLTEKENLDLIQKNLFYHLVELLKKKEHKDLLNGLVSDLSTNRDEDYIFKRVMDYSLLFAKRVSLKTPIKIDSVVEEKTNLIENEKKENEWLVFDSIEDLKDLDLEDGVVYAYYFNNMVKIGSSIRVYNRLRSLNSNFTCYHNKTFKKVAISTSHPKYAENERLLHKHFEKYRVDNTELFKFDLNFFLKNAPALDVTPKKTRSFNFDMNFTALFASREMGEKMFNFLDIEILPVKTVEKRYTTTLDYIYSLAS